MRRFAKQSALYAPEYLLTLPEKYRVTDYFPHTSEDGMPENETITQDDIAGLIAVAQFLDAMELEGEGSQVGERMRELAAKLARFVVA